MKIALLSFEYPPETGNGGIGTYTWYHARALAKLGHTVHVLAGETKPAKLQQTQHDGITVYRFRTKGLLMRGFKSFEKLGMWWTKNRLENALSMFEGFRQLNRMHQYDIVEMPECGAEGLLINRLVKIPAVVRLHSPAQLIMPFYDVKRSDITFCSFLELRGITGATALTACSNFITNEAREKMNVRDPIQVIPNGIDLALFEQQHQQQDICKKFEIRADKPIVFFSGRMENRKGIYLCKEIVSSVLERHDISFVFAGQDLFHYVRDLLLPYWKTKKLKGTVHYLGKIDQSSIRSLLHRSDIFLFPSLWENCPYSCLEAMASGCAIVSTDQGGMPEMIRHEMNGVLAKSGDSSSYVNSIERLLENSILRKRLGEEARKTVKSSFNDIQVAERSTEVYRRLML